MIRTAFLVVSILVVSPFAHGLGTDYAPGPIEGSSAWPKNTLALINSGERVGGFWVNQCDSFFYRGDAAALNEFIKQYSLIDGTPLKLVLHAGAKPLTGKLAEKPTIPFNWALQVNLRGWGAPKDPRLKDSNGYVVTLSVWLGDGITLDTLHVPSHVEVVSARDIEKFIEKHADWHSAAVEAAKSQKSE